MKTGQIRVSSDEQKKEGQQVSAYYNELKYFGVPEDNIFLELARSGSMSEDKDMNVRLSDGKLIISFDLHKKRPEFYKFLINKISKGKVDEHYINSWSRFARNIILQEALVILFDKYNTKIIATRDVNDNKGRLMIGCLNHIESIFTKERVQFNKQFKFEQGLYLGTKRLYGYKKTKILIGGREFLHLIPKSSELPMINEIYSDLDYKEVCTKYNISPVTYHNIRKNKFYAGYINYNGEEKLGLHKPLISLEQWERVN